MAAGGNIAVLVILTLVTGVVCLFSFGGPRQPEYNVDPAQYRAYEERTSWLDALRIPLAVILLLVCLGAWLRRDSDIMVIAFGLAALAAAAVSRLPMAAKLACLLAALGVLVLYQLQQGVPLGEILQQLLDA